jgi:hypothetical protein
VSKEAEKVVEKVISKDSEPKIVSKEVEKVEEKVVAKDNEPKIVSKEVEKVVAKETEPKIESKVAETEPKITTKIENEPKILAKEAEKKETAKVESKGNTPEFIQPVADNKAKKVGESEIKSKVEVKSLSIPKGDLPTRGMKVSQVITGAEGKDKLKQAVKRAGGSGNQSKIDFMGNKNLRGSQKGK